MKILGLMLALIILGGIKLSFAEVQLIKVLTLLENIDPKCFQYTPQKPVMILDERFVNVQGSQHAPTSCKGGNVCWSWKVKNIWDWDITIYSSDLPLKISNINKVSESISQSIKEAKTLRKNKNDAIQISKEFINTYFGAQKEGTITKERALTQSESRERTMDANLVLQFHTFLTKGLIGPFIPYSYVFCISSAVDLFFKAFYSDRVNTLVEAFILYKTFKPEDLDFTNSTDTLNRAKLIYAYLDGLAENYAVKDIALRDLRDRIRDYSWAQAILLAKLVEWKEFQEIRNEMDNYVAKVSEAYKVLLSQNTIDIAGKDKELALWKFIVDSEILELEKKSKEELKQLQKEIRDNYLMASVISSVKQANKEAVKKFNDSLQSNSSVLIKQYIIEEAHKKNYGVFLLFLVVISFVGIGFVYKGKKILRTLRNHPKTQ